MTRLSAAQLAAMREQHVEYSEEPVCVECDEPWPCDAARLLDHIDAVEREVAALKGVVHDALYGGAAHVWHDRVKQQYCVAFDGPWVLRAQAALDATPQPDEGSA